MEDRIALAGALVAAAVGAACKSAVSVRALAAITGAAVRAASFDPGMGRTPEVQDRLRAIEPCLTAQVEAAYRG